MMDVVARFWDLPKVEHGAAQVPYIYPPEMMDELNAILRVSSSAGAAHQACHAISL